MLRYTTKFLHSLGRPNKNNVNLYHLNRAVRTWAIAIGIRKRLTHIEDPKLDKSCFIGYTLFSTGGYRTTTKIKSKSDQQVHIWYQ